MCGGFARLVLWHSLRERGESSMHGYSRAALDDRGARRSTASLPVLLSVEVPPSDPVAAAAHGVPIARPST